MVVSLAGLVTKILVLALLGLAACEPSRGPALVQVTGVVAQELREGDTLELRGQPFPEGRPVDVTLRGEVRRPGASGRSGFELTLQGKSASTHSVTVPITRKVEQAMTGAEGAGHATFRGSIEVSFRPRVSGTPPVTGELAEAVLDFVPAEEDAALAAAREEKGRAFAAFAGLLLERREGVFTVEGVMPDSPAERAGVTAGDRLVELDGVRLLELSDLLPAAEARVSELAVERAGMKTRLRLDVARFEPIAAGKLAPLAGIVLALALFFGIVASPLGRGLSLLEWRLVEKLRAAQRRAPRFGHANRRAPLASALMTVLPATAGPYVAVVAACAVVTALGFGRPLVARELDLVVVLVAAYAALGLAALLFGARGERGVVARLRRVLLVAVQALVAFAAFGSVVLATGGLGADELALTQGPWPWDYWVLRGPLPLFSFAILALSLVPEAPRGPSDPGAPATPGRDRRRTLPEIVASAHLVLVSGVAALAFLGGARSGADRGGTVVSLIGIALLLLKTVGMSGLVLLARRAFGPFDLADARGPLFTRLLPAALVCFCASVVMRRLANDTFRVALERSAAACSFAVALAVLLLLARRAFVGVRQRSADAGLNPWI
jgi:membrane-associated protease RseP (regulator of RpoE activity)